MYDIFEDINIHEEAEDYEHPDKWTTFPPPGDKKRLDRYKVNKALLKCRHGDVYKDVQAALERGKGEDALVYIVANFASVVTFTCADLLLGTPPDITAGKADGKTDKAVQKLIVDNDFLKKTYEGELSRSYRGDSVLKVRFGKPKWWLTPQTIIEYVPAQHYFPHLGTDNFQEESGATLAWLKNDGDGKMYLKKEIHTPGTITNKLFHMKGSQIGDQVAHPADIFPDEYKDWKETEETGYPGLLVEHVPNWRLDDEYFGNSDYLNLHTLFDELNNRISQISAILDKHSDPILIGPDEIMNGGKSDDPNYPHRKEVSKKNLEYVGVSEPEDTELFKYLTWDAHLEAAFKQIDNLLDIMMMVSEISPAVFGMDKFGIAESGRAMKFRLMRTIQKVNRKKLYLDTGIKNILYAAQVIDNKFTKASYPVEDVTITWHVDIPKDEREEAETEQIRTGNKATTSQKQAIQRLDGTTEAQAQSTLDEIHGDMDFENGLITDDSGADDNDDADAEDGIKDKDTK